MAVPYGLSTKTMLVTTNVNSMGLEAVASTRTRWITFLYVANIYGGEQTIYFASCQASSITGATTGMKVSNASTRAKFVVRVTPNQNLPVGQADPAHPLFSIAASKFLCVQPTRGQARVTIQYFDQ